MSGKTIQGAGSFKKGRKAWNKGMRGRHFSPNTEWKKGQPGRNWLPVGSMTIRRDKTGNLRQWIKIAEPNKWTEYAKHVWAKHHGEIPKGRLIHHCNGDSRDDRIENLSMLTRRDHFAIHGIGEKGRAAIKEKSIKTAKRRLAKYTEQHKLELT